MATSESFEVTDSRAKLRGYLELLRLPNVFTAFADVLMGYLLTHVAVGGLQAPPPAKAGPAWLVALTHAVTGSPQWLVLVLLASGCLYLAGMVLNDVFDYAQDLAERPTRPLPAGLVPMRTAATLGYLLLAAGIAFGWIAAVISQTPATGIAATLVAVMVWLYDRILKRTPLGPLAMGSCRFFNVLMAMSPGTTIWLPSDWVVAGGIGTYIVGVTLFARREAATSHRWQLTAGTVVMGCGLALLWWFPWSINPLERMMRAPYVAGLGTNWTLLWVLIGLSIGFRCQQAISHPVKLRVQMAVKHALVSLIVIDAAVCFAAQGQYPSLVILALLAPMVFIGRWIYST